MSRLSCVLLAAALWPAATVAQTYDAEVRIDEELLDRFAQAALARGVNEKAVWHVEGAQYDVTAAGVRLRGLVTALVTYTIGGPGTLREVLDARSLLRQKRAPGRYDGPPLRITPVATRRRVDVFAKAFDLPVSVTATGKTVRLQVNPASVTVLDGAQSTLVSLRPADYFNTAIQVAPRPYRLGGEDIQAAISQLQVATQAGAIRARFSVGF